MAPQFLRSLFGRIGASGDAYVAGREAEPAFAANTAAIRDLEAELTPETAKLLMEAVKDLTAAESAREGAIQTRAQGLLVGQAFLTAMLTLGAGASLGKGAFQGYWAYALLGLAAAVVLAGLLLTWNALQALSGQAYPKLGWSDLRAAVSAPLAGEGAGTKTSGFQTVTVPRTLQNYRRSVLRNDWRMTFLARAQSCLWVSIVALAALVLTVFASVFWPGTPPPAPSAAPVVVRMPALELPSLLRPAD